MASYNVKVNKGYEFEWTVNNVKTKEEAVALAVEWAAESEWFVGRTFFVDVKEVTEVAENAD